MLTFRLDDLIKLAGLPEPNHIKIDVDGAEIAVLEGAAETLEAPGLESVMIEVARKQWDDVFRLLEGHGFSLRAKFDERDGQPMAVWYGLFARPGS